MTLFAGIAPRLGGLVAQRAVQVAAAGLLSGAVAGSVVVATGLSPFDASRTGGTVAVMGCPGSGPELARISAGQTMLVTARSLDGHWLQIYLGEPGIALAWAPAAALRLQSGVANLPVAGCQPSASAEPPATPLAAPSPVASVLASLVPDETAPPAPRSTATAHPTTTPTPTPKPTPKPTPTHTPKPTPVPTVDPNPPQLSSEQSQYACIGTGGSSSISVVVTDPDGDLTSVTIGVTAPGAPFGTLYNMTHPKFSNIWSYTINAVPGWSDGYVHYTVTARDSDGNSVSQSSTDAPWSTSTGNSVYFMGGGCLF